MSGNRVIKEMPYALLLAAAVALSGCTAPDPAPSDVQAQIQQLEARIAELEAQLAEQQTPVNLVSPHYPPAAAGDPGWDYHKTLTADVDGDGVAEKVHVVTNAFWMPEQQEFGWDDGHPWHVYVDEPDGDRTYVFSNWVQMGVLDVILDAESPGLYIVSSRGGGLTIYRVSYRGPGETEAVLAFQIPLSDYATLVDPQVSSH